MRVENIKRELQEGLPRFAVLDALFLRFFSDYDKTMTLSVNEAMRRLYLKLINATLFE